MKNEDLTKFCKLTQKPKLALKGDLFKFAFDGVLNNCLGIVLTNNFELPVWGNMGNKILIVEIYNTSTDSDFLLSDKIYPQVKYLSLICNQLPWEKGYFESIRQLDNSIIDARLNSYQINHVSSNKYYNLHGMEVAPDEQALICESLIHSLITLEETIVEEFLYPPTDSNRIERKLV